MAETEAGVMLIEAAAISELAKQYTGTSDEKLWSPKELGAALEQYAKTRKNEALKRLEGTFNA